MASENHFFVFSDIGTNAGLLGEPSPVPVLVNTYVAPQLSALELTSARNHAAPALLMYTRKKPSSAPVSGSPVAPPPAPPFNGRATNSSRIIAWSTVLELGAVKLKLPADA